MESITRKEMYLAKMSGDYSGPVPEPVTRMDYYMVYAAGAYNGPLPKPIRQQEFYWAYICGATDIVLPKPVTRIDMYLAAMCGGMLFLPEPITREEIYLAKIAKQSEAVVKSAAGKTIVLTDSMEAPFEDFRIYGHTTQDGIPTPENPVELVSAGDKRNAQIEIHGRNLFDANTLSFFGWNGTLEVTDNGIVMIAINGWMACFVDTSKYKGKEVTVSFRWRANLDESTDTVDVRKAFAVISSESGAVFPFNYTVKYSSDTVIASFEQVMVTFVADSYTGFLNWLSKEGTGLKRVIEIEDIQIQLGNKAAEYESPKTPQVLNFSTPNSFPGIPVASGGNYTDENGQQWIADYRDWQRGVDVHRIHKIIFDGFEGWAHRITSNNNNNFQIILTEEERASTTNTCGMSNYLSYKNVSWDDNIINLPKIYAYDREITVSFPPDSQFNSLDAWTNWLSEKGDFEFVYVLKTPIETPISADELATYHALHTNTPTSTIVNDEDCWMDVSYKAKPISQYSEAMMLEYRKGE